MKNAGFGWNEITEVDRFGWNEITEVDIIFMVDYN